MREPNFKLYYNPYNVIKRGKLINLCNGGRGTGKTFGYKYYVIDDFIKNKNECVWVRRTDAALQEMTKSNGFFKDIETYFDNEFKSDSRTGFVDNKECVHFIPLSQGNKFKSVAYPNVNKMIFDEYIIGADDNTQHYLKNEVYLFLNLISTIFRDRDNFQVFLLGNFETVDNPYMQYFKCYPSKNQIYTSNGDVLVQQYENKEFEEHIENTRFGKLIKNTEFGNFAIKNKSLSDNDKNIKQFTNNMYFLMGIRYNNYNFGFWYNDNDEVIVSNKINEKGYIEIMSDISVLVSRIKYSKNKYYELIKNKVALDSLYFENIVIKRNFIDNFATIFGGR